MDCSDDCDLRCDFAGNYEKSALPEIKALEEAVLGCDYGGTSWTTMDQTAHIIASLELDEDTHLLELGSGSGWPSLYVATQTGCSATLVDLPPIALQQAARRAEADGIGDRIETLQGDATALPFDAGNFSRIGHSDVLCCLPQKFEMLSECRRVAETGARMHFSVIKPAPNLSDEDLQLALDTGPPFVGHDEPYRDMLAKTEWSLVDRVDLTQEYGESLQQLADGLRAHADKLQSVYDENELRELWDHRDAQAALVRDGKMQRFAYVAIAD